MSERAALSSTMAAPLSDGSSNSTGERQAEQHVWEEDGCSGLHEIPPYLPLVILPYSDDDALDTSWCTGEGDVKTGTQSSSEVVLGNKPPEEVGGAFHHCRRVKRRKKRKNQMQLFQVRVPKKTIEPLEDTGLDGSPDLGHEKHHLKKYNYVSFLLGMMPSLKYMLREASAHQGARCRGPNTSGTRRSIWDTVVLICLLTWAAFFGERTIRRCKDWNSERALFESALEVCPNGIKTLNNLATGMLNLEEAGKAEELLRRAVEVKVYL